MTPQEEIEYICNAAYLRGCDSNFKTAIAGMQEGEISRLNYEMVAISRFGSPAIDLDDSCVHVKVFGATSDFDAARSVYAGLEIKEPSRLAELVKLIKEGA